MDTYENTFFHKLWRGCRAAIEQADAKACRVRPSGTNTYMDHTHLHLGLDLHSSS